MPTNNKKTFYVVKIQAQPSGQWGYIKKSLDVNSFLNGSIEWTADRSEAEHFGFSLADQVAKKRGGKVSRITVTTVKKKTVTKTTTTTTAASTTDNSRKCIYVAIVLDGSGSMGGLETDTIRAINRIIDETKAAAKATGIRTLLNMWILGAGIQHVIQNVLIQDVKPFDRFIPSGGTPLFQAVGMAIKEMSTFPDNDQTSFLLHTITDGEENASSTEYGTAHNPANFTAAVKGKQSTDKWTFTFLLPPGHKDRFVRLSGVHAGNCSEWEATAQGVQRYTGMVTNSTHQYYGAASAAPVAKANVMRSQFFTTDMSGVDLTDLKRKFSDISSKFVNIPVDREQQIEELVKARGFSYRKGDAFYALTKSEKIQSHKKILIKVKGQKAVYGGTEARQVLGLPNYEVRVKPGDHRNFDIYVESNSTNRKLVRGTHVLYLKDGEAI